MTDKAVFCFVKANPPTKDLEVIIKQVVTLAEQQGADPLIFVSHEYDAQQNPIPWKFRVDYLKKYLNNAVYVCSDDDVQDIEDVAEFLYHHDYKNIVMITASENIIAMESELKQKNGKADEEGQFKFTDIKIVSYGGNDPDSEESTEGTSGPAARNAVMDGDYQKFASMVMARGEVQAKQLYAITQLGLGMKEAFKAILNILHS